MCRNKAIVLQEIKTIQVKTATPWN